MPEPSDIEARFKVDTAQHRLTIAQDSGFYRFLRFHGPRPSWYWFDLITVPGTLVFQGDGEAFVFWRTRDMFQFFRSSPDRAYGPISPAYWATKLATDQGRARRYSPDLFRQIVFEEVEEATRGGALPGLVQAVRDDLAEHDLEHEYAAREWAESFLYWAPGGQQDRSPDFRFTDVFEWDAKAWNPWFLWACHAIVWGIARYDTAKAEGLS
jgi:hypothetical protein